MLACSIDMTMAEPGNFCIFLLHINFTIVANFTNYILFQVYTYWIENHLYIVMVVFKMLESKPSLGVGIYIPVFVKFASMEYPGHLYLSLLTL